jgi:hypothetical protein
MPPQRSESEITSGEQAAGTATPDGQAGAAAPSYWDPPKEQSLQGKTLSTLDMTALEHSHPDEEKEKNDTYWEPDHEKVLEGKSISELDIAALEHSHPGDADMKIAASPPKTPVVAEEPNVTPSYWDAPQEKALQGKTLSTLDMSALEHSHPDEEKKKNDSYWEADQETTLQGKTLSTLDMTMLEANNPAEKAEKRESYWEGAAIDKTLEGKTLSILELSALETNHPDEKKETNDSYWDAPEEQKLQNKTLSTIDMVTLEKTSESNSGRPPSYWDDAPIDKSLQGKTLSTLDMAAMDKQHVDQPATNPGDAAPYWDWKIKDFKKSLSKLSLSNLRKGSANDTMVDDDFNPIPGSRTSSSNSLNSNGEKVKPITQKVHKLRNAWRKSFQHLSTNTLDQLDESNSSGPRIMGKRIFKSRNVLDVSGGSMSSTGSGSDAPMF